MNPTTVSPTPPKPSAPEPHASDVRQLGVGASALDERIASILAADRRASRRRAIGVPLAAVLLALAIGGLLIALEGSNPVGVYRTVVTGVFGDADRFRDTLVAAAPLTLIGVGLALAYRARVFTIGAEGQYVVGALVAVAVVTAPGLRDLPSLVLVPAALVVGAAAGGLWGSIVGGLAARFGASVVITSLLLNYVAFALLQWGVRVAFRDPNGFVPQSRPIGEAALPKLPWLGVHAGVVLAAVAASGAWVLLARTRFGFRTDVLGHNPTALDANETRSASLTTALLVLSGALAGLAGIVEVQGVATRVNPEFPTGLGYTAIIVALLGRLHPMGALIAAVGLSALTIGFETAERSYALPSSIVGVIEALVVLFVVAGDALAARRTR